MGSAVKETLKSLCCTYGWSYGVLWRFDQQNPMFLTLGDAYEDQMRGLIDDMLLQVHILGQGVVGDAAFTGKDQWIRSDGHCQDESLMGSVSYEDDEACSEFHDQYEFGIKTVVAIPLDSHGVVQFGSTKEIPESLEFSNRTKKLLLENINIQQVTASLTVNYGSDEWFDSLLSEGLSACRNKEPRLSDTSDERRGEICDALNIADSQASVSKVHHETVDTDGGLSDMMSLEQLFPAETTPGSPFFFPPFLATPITSNGAGQNFQGDSQFASDYSIEELLDVENTVQVNPGKDVFRWPIVPSDLRAMQVNSGNDVPTSSGPKISGVDIPFNCQAPSVLNVTNALSHNTPAKLSNPFSCLVQDFESSRSLAPHLQSCPPTVSSCISGISELDAIYASRPRKGLFSELGLEQLLNGTVHESVPVNRSSNNDPQSTSKRRKIVSSSPSGSQIQSEVFSCLSDKISSFQHHLKVATSEDLGSQRDFTLKPQAGMWIDDRQSINGRSNNLTLPKRAPESTKPIKKRAKPGESTRPRPKDRQQFQDRLCDLRKMIPNTGKLSIDALLDSTIKHLIFLQNVTMYAEKLKRIADQKDKGASSKNNANGVTWAWELSDQAMICPIKVEDVGSSGEMLIEMLCDDGVSFLQIADAIRGFGLRILTGSIEDRNEKTWARYVVEPETSRSVTRVDVFWSLAQHLQQATSSGINTVSQLPLRATCHQQNLPQPISADARR